MAGFADLFYRGQPDPARLIAQQLAGQQPLQPQGPQGPQPTGAPAAAANANAQGGGAAPNPNPSAPSPGEPMALQSPSGMAAANATLANPPNLMSLYMQLDARNRAEDQINRGFALIAANHSSPAMAHAIMESVGGQPDAGQQVGNLMQLYQTQQTMGAQQQMLGQAPAIAQKLGLPEEVVRAQILAGRGSELVSQMEQTPEQKNIQWEHDQFIKGGGDEATWQRDYLPMIISRGMAGAGDPMFQTYMQERRQAQQTDPNTPFPNYADWTAQRQAQALAEKEHAATVQKAKDSFDQYHSGLLDVRSKVQSVLSNPELDNVLGNTALVTLVRNSLSGDLKGNLFDAAANAGYRPEQVQLVKDILDISAPDYTKGVQGKGMAFSGGGDILPITSALTPLNRLGTPPKQYRTMLNGALDAVDEARKNAYTTSGQTVPKGLGETTDLRGMTDAQADAAVAQLPPGAKYIGPDGAQRRK